MAVRYQPLLGPADDDTQEQDGAVSPLSQATSSATTGLSPLSSPTLSNYLTLAEQTFTPLSMDGSDYCLSEGGRDDEVDRDANDATVAAAVEKTGLLRRSTARAGRRHSRGFGSVGAGGIFGRGSTTSASTAPVQVPVVPASATLEGRGAPTIVSQMVQSFEALRAARTATGYDLISTKNTANGHQRRHPDPGLVSPPSTVSPSPSPSLSPLPSPSRSPERNTRKTPAAASASQNSAVDADAAPLKKAPVTGQDTHENNSHGSRLLPVPAAEATAGNTNIGQTYANSILPTNSTSITDFAFSTGAAEATLVRPTPVNSPPHTPRFPSDPIESVEPSIVRTSSTASVTINHPTPDPNRRSRSGANLGNIAALEASAERLSMTSSIEDAIRQEHEELKRSDSRRSSILRANSSGSARKTSCSDTGSVRGQGRLSVVSRQSSIVGLNSTARIGGYSPAGYIMSPQPSLSGVSARLRSGSKASSLGAPTPMAANHDSSVLSTDVGNGEDFPFMSRSGPGKSSTRSVASKLSHVQAVELDHPTTLTEEAFEKADHAAVAGEDADDDDTIRASAYQHIEAQFADHDDDHTDARQPMLDHEFLEDSAPRLQLHEPGTHPLYQEPQESHGHDRPMTSGSGATYDQAQTAFGDFDGVHCDPDVDDFVPPPPPELLNEDRPRPRLLPPPRPTSYFDPSTGQQMLYYPAPVPAMLNLPPKLSKKPKAAARQMRRSELIVNAMPQQSRESRVWLPDPMQGLGGSGEPFMTDVLLDDNLGSPAPLDAGQTPPMSGMQGDELAPQPFEPLHARHASETSTIHPAQTTTAPGAAAGREIRRPQRLTDVADKRKTRAAMLEGLPPQLRASAFFDLPSATPRVEMKGGSAMATLDSILDASASAPVSAFTDHAFAGKLGSEVYGPEKKRKKTGENRKTMTMAKPTSDLLQPDAEPKKRASHFSLLGGRRKHSEDLDTDAARTTVGLVGGEDGIHRDGSSPGLDQEPLSPNELAPDADELSDEEEDEEEEEEEELYHGPPTTLLAELQLRKQQNKLRTRPIVNAYPNGMHSTLLELDAVAEMERKARRGKRVNLAWEDPNANPDHLEDLDDDDVPLGMLAVAKATGMDRSTMDISAVMNEVNRPLGLMERRELEDNEPLSRRRERLQGKQSSLVPASLDVMQQRISQLNLSPYGSSGALGLRSQSRFALPLPSPGPGSVTGSANGAGAERDEEPEVEGETLAERKARLAAENPLPRARPVSGLFSSELLGQFGEPEDNQSRPNSKDAKAKGKENTPPGDVPEEEETLGQRRKRLQAEKEAREREMGGVGNAGGIRMVVPGGDDNRVSRRLSMADMLGAHPMEAARGMIDPREEERLKREQESLRVQRDKEFKMAAMRAQMPQTLVSPTVGARTGGYMNGAFNDGLGGTVGGATAGLGLGYGLGAQQRLSTIGPVGGYAAPVGVAQYGGGVPPMNMGMGMNANMNPAYGGYGVPLPLNGQGHVDMVERWRQGVMP